MKSIIKKELNTMCTSPAYFIILTVFIGVLNFLFLKGFFLDGIMNFRGYFDLQIWFLMIFIPAISMRIISEELKTQTLELLFTKPISLLHIIGGKYVSLLIYFGVFIISTLILYFSLSILGSFPGGIIVSQILGSILLIGSMFSISFLASSITKNQVFAFLLGVFLNFILIIIGSGIIQLSLPGFIASFLNGFSIMTHMGNFSKGVVSLSDVIYFLSIIFFGLYLSYVSLKQFQKTGKTGLGVLSVSELCIVMGILIVGNALMSKIHFFIDVTPGNIYTLSESTKSVLSEVDDTINIDFYASKELPPELKLLSTNLHDTLDQFNTYAHNNIKFHEISTEEESAQTEAQKAGIPPIQIQTMKNDQFATQKGYLGVVIKYVDKAEVIPYIGNEKNLEYSLVSKILKLTQKTRKKVSIITNDTLDDKLLQNLGNTFNETYDIHVQKIKKDTEKVSSDDDIFIVLENEAFPSKVSESIQSFLGNKVVLYFFQPYTIDLKNGLTASKNVSELATKVLEKYHLTLGDGLVGDAKYNLPVNFNQGNVTYMVSYSLFPKIFVTNGQSGQEQQTISAPFIGSLEGGETGTTDILTTSDFGFLQKDISKIAPDALGSMTNKTFSKISVGKLIQNATSKVAIIPSTALWTMIGNDSIASNLTFASNLTDTLGGDPRLINIRSKSLSFENFAHDAFKANLIRGINVYALPILLLLAGLGIAFFRNKKRA